MPRKVISRTAEKSPKLDASGEHATSDTVERVACLLRVCYKFLTSSGLGPANDKCLSSIFLRAKLTASWCTTVPVWAERPRTCNGSTTTLAKTKKGKWFRWRPRPIGRCFSIFFRSTWAPYAGFKTRFHLYTVPGQVFYEASRKLILKGADGVVFVADSQEERLDANFETMENLQEHLKEHNLSFDTIPYVLQLNKRDLPNAMPVPDLTKQLQRKGEPVLEGVAVTGQGVFETSERTSEARFGGTEKERLARSICDPVAAASQRGSDEQSATSQIFASMQPVHR